MSTLKEEKVILVDSDDMPIGTMEKMEAHRKGLLHRAFSVFVFNQKGELMLQQRALHKYHSGGLWTNTCCSHPREGESIEQAAHRRIVEEMGFDCPMEYVFHFIYKAELDQGLTEHEFDHVLIGFYEETPELNPDEVMDWDFVSLDMISNELKNKPDKYTAWFQIIFEKVSDRLQQLLKEY